MMSRTVLLLIVLAVLVTMVADAQNNKKKKKNKNKNNNGGGKKKNKNGGGGGGNSNSEPQEEEEEPDDMVDEDEDDLDLSFNQDESISNYDIYLTQDLELDFDLLYLSGDQDESYIMASVVLSYEKVEAEEDEEPMILDSMGPMVMTAQARYFDSALELKENRDFDRGTSFRDIEFLELESGSGIAVDVNPSRDYGQVKIFYKLTQESFDDLTSEVLRMGKDQQGNGVLMLNNKPGYARTWIPCQDSPFVKPKVTMNLRVPDGYTALGTGSRLRRPTSDDNTSSFRYFFPISLQSLSLFVGKVELAERSGRTSVWLTPTDQDDENYVKLSGLRRIDTLLETCERMAGPLVDEHVNVVVLPSTISVSAFEYPGPSVIYVPNELVNTENNINDRDTFVVLEMAVQLFKNWFKVLLTPADERMSHLLDGISEYLALRATSEVMGDNAQLFRLLSAAYHHKPSIPLFGPIYGINYMKQLGQVTSDPSSITKALRLFILYHAYETVGVEDFSELMEMVYVNNRDNIHRLNEYLHTCYRQVCSDLVVDESGEEGPEYRQVRQVDEMMIEMGQQEEPEVKVGKIKKLSYEQILYMTSRVSYTEGLSQKTLKKLTSVLQKTGHYDDSFIRPRWIVNVMSRGYGYNPLLQDALTIAQDRGPSDLISRSLIFLVQQYAEAKQDRALLKQVRVLEDVEDYEGFVIAELFLPTEVYS